MQPLIELITLWQQYTDKNPAANVEWFCRDVITKKTSAQKHLPAQDLLFARQMGKLSSLINAYFKLSLKYIPGVEPEWYYFLDTIIMFKEVRKTDVLSFRLLLEPTTCIDILNRMIKAGLITEKVSAEDKRARLINATPKGMLVFEKMSSLFEHIAAHLLAAIDADDKAKLHLKFQTINNEHFNSLKINKAKGIENMEATVKMLAEQIDFSGI